jgi:hypothetical protein
MDKLQTVELLKQEYLKSQAKLHGISIAIQDATKTNTSLTYCLPRLEKVIASILDLEREANPIAFDMDVMEYIQGNHPLEELIKEWQKEEPIIPELGEGLEMHVSNGGVDWFNIKIIGKYKGKYISNVFATFEHARPIQPKKVTMAELEELVGGKFEIIK